MTTLKDLGTYLREMYVTLKLDDSGYRIHSISDRNEEIFHLFNLHKNHNYMAAPQRDPVTLSAFEAFKRLTIKFTK